MVHSYSRWSQDRLWFSIFHSHTGFRHGYEAQICRDLARRERCQQFDIGLAIREVSADMLHLGDVER